MLRTALAGTLGLTAFVKAAETPSISSFDIIENALEGASLVSLAITAPKRDRKLSLKFLPKFFQFDVFLTRYFFTLEEDKIQEFKSTTVPCQYWWDNKWYDLTSFNEAQGFYTSTP